MQKSLERLAEGLKGNLAAIRARLKPLFSIFNLSLRDAIRQIKTRRKLQVALLIAGFPLIFFLVLLSVVAHETPDKRVITGFRNPVPSEVYTADSVLIGRYLIQDRTPVRYEEISPWVIKALVATEDVRFYDHRGIDFKSLGRVLIKSILLQDESSGGGSTITQQLAKNIFPRKEYWTMSILINKLREAFIAAKIESTYTKEEILTRYLNTVPFGDNTYGIQAAARRFFSTDVKALSATQAAVLVGMLKATHNYNPRLFPSQALSRRNVVLRQMEKYSMISPPEYNSLKKLPLELRLGEPEVEKGIAPYFMQHLRSVLETWCQKNKKSDGTPYNLYADGLRIYTTLDSRLQRYAESAVTRQMKELQVQFFNHSQNEKPWENNEAIISDAVKRTSRYEKLRKSGRSEEEIMGEMRKPVATQFFTWNGPKKVTASPIDSIQHHIQYLNAGFLAMDPASGQVKAWVGGIDFNFFQYDHVRETTKRQVGSVFKPIVYAQAIEQGVSPCEFISAGQQTYIDDEGQRWTPRNSQYDYPVTYSMRGALAYSVNTVAVKLIDRAGIKNTIRLARNMGIQHSDIPGVPSIALGTSEISLTEMTAAYACIANEGISSYPFFVKSITDRDGKRFENFTPDVSGQRAMSGETAQLVRQMLQTVVQEGTAARLRYKYGVYNDVAAKTGTTQANADGWFMAITPKLVMGTWVGAEDPRISFKQTRFGEASNTALPVVAYFLQQINQDKDYKDISKARFRPVSGAAVRKLNCDLYELNDDLWASIEKSLHVRDSIMRADSLSTVPPETFLQTLYNRKRKIILASQQANEQTASMELTGQSSAPVNH